MHYVSSGREQVLEGGKILLPSEHIITEKEFRNKLFKEKYKVKQGGLSGELYNIGKATDLTNFHGPQPLSYSVEEYSLNSDYTIANYHIQVSPFGSHSVHQWFGIPPGSRD